MISMRKTRKTISIEAEYVELLKEIAKARGMSVSSYIRRLITEVAKAEEIGLFAPRALSEKRAEVLLNRFGFTLVPVDIITSNISDEDLLSRGMAIGKTMVELEIDPFEVIELIGLSNQIIVPQGDNIVILPQQDELKRKLTVLLIGMARGADLKLTESRDIVIISPSKRSQISY